MHVSVKEGSSEGSPEVDRSGEATAAGSGPKLELGFGSINGFSRGGWKQGSGGGSGLAEEGRSFNDGEGGDEFY